MPGEASSSGIFPERRRWSLLVTRLPAYKIECSSHWNHYKQLKAKSGESEDLKSALACIDSSVQRNGNPRLINFSIAALIESFFRAKKFQFESWQKKLAELNIFSKFTVSKCGEGLDVLTSQSNLLLGASAHCSLADAMIHRHYAQRAFPDQGESSGCKEGSKDSDCGGWLRIAPDDWRCLGRILYTESLYKDHEKKDFSASDWQTTMFQTVQNDILLYLASCWESGYLSVYKHKDGLKYSCYRFRSFDFMRAT
jgi:hypothetical protein